MIRRTDARTWVHGLRRTINTRRKISTELKRNWVSPFIVMSLRGEYINIKSETVHGRRTHMSWFAR